MKTSFIFSFLLLSYAVNAQLSTFYTTNTNASFNERTGYSILKANETKGNISYKSLNEEVIDLEVFWTFDKKNADSDDIVSLTFGQDKAITLQYQLADGKCFIIQNEKSIEVNFINGYSSEGNLEQHSLMFRITPSYLQIMQTGELGGNYFLKPLHFDNRNFELKAQAKSPIDVKVSFLEYHFPKLNCIAKSNLSIRESNSLSSKKIGSIPYGEPVIVLNKTAKPEGFSQMSYHDVVDTKGDLKVEDLTSKMIKILYKGQIGYAYGGYLLPLRKHTAEDGKHVPNLNNWTNEFIVFDQIYDKDFAVIKKIKIDFRLKPWQGLTASQRGLVLKTLFPNLKMFQSDHYKTLITGKNYFSGDEEDLFPVRYADYKHEEYIENEMDEELTVGTFHFNKNEPIVFEYEEVSIYLVKKLEAITAYVTASSLNMRQTSDPKSKVISKIPFGEKVEKQYQPDENILTIGGVRGIMQKIKYGKQTGYIFDAYLSPIQPPKRKMNSFDLNQVIQKSTQVQHFSDNGQGRDFCKIPHYSPQWIIVSTRDKHQIIKTFRKAFPNLELLKFNWDEAKQDYIISTNSNKILVHQTSTSWCIIFGGESDYERTIIIIEILDDNIQKITVTEEFMGD
jgi:uncharacterized protein YgiM (DUF1202 family)